MSRMLSQSMRALTLVAITALLIAGYPMPVVAQAAISVNGERYMIVLKPPKAGVPTLTDADVAGVGGHTEYKVTGRIEVTMSAAAVESLRAQGRVKYIQKMILGPLPNASAAPALRLTPSAMSLRRTAEATPPTWTTGTYRYDTSGNIYAIGLAGDAGAPVQHRYAYDKLSRLTGADTITTSTYSETFTYDPYGNMIQHIDGGATTPTPADTATNRLQWSAAHPYVYDAAGNLTADYNATYAYDPFSMLREKDYTGMQPEYYIYTASDERIGVKYASYPDSATVWSIRDFSGNVLRQFEGHDTYPGMSWLWVEDYVYGEGRLLAAERVPEEGGRRYVHLDHLGSPRLVTGQDGQEMSEHDFAPFGLESNPLWQETAGGFDREDPKRFTGHERDYAGEGPPQSTFYLDYMHARYYSVSVGRFLSVDPVKGDPRQPQTWNAYGYVQNNPLSLVDPRGLWSWNPLEWFRKKQGELPKSERCFECAFYGVKPDVTVYAKDPAPQRESLPSRYAGMLGRFAQSDVDYMTVNVNVAIPNPYTLTFVGYTFGVTADRYSRLYPMWRGAGVGKSLSGVSASVTWGNLVSSTPPTPKQLNQFITGHGINFAAGSFFGGGLTYSPNMPSDTPSVAGEFGLFTPQIGATYSYTSDPLP